MSTPRLNTQGRVAVFAVGLAVVFAAALGVGNAVGPVADEPVAHDDEHAGDAAGSGDGGHGDAGHDEGASGAAELPGGLPGGLMVSQAGYTLQLAGSSAPAGRDVPLAFTIEGPDGHPVTAFDVEHEKRLHLIVVRRDFSGFQHVHPELDADGVWTTGLDLTPGTWRVFADFRATGAEALTLGADLTVPGDYRPEPPADERRVARVDDYEVTLDGDLTAGTDSELRLAVTKDGRPVTDLEPYLGASGHLVALRGGDLAYLHVHAEEGDGLVFYAAVPSEGDYRLFLDFKHDGVVRTASFALSTEAGHDDH